jgi:enoyl-CoA hydratase/carnithine racemase
VNYQHILYEVSDKIATVTLNRPDRMNAWTATMERDVRHAMEAAAGDDGVRVIVLTGAGRAFCAGADMEALQAIDPGETTSFARRGLIAEHGISWMLPRIVGHANALDLLMSARRVSSEEALRIGLVNRLYPPDQLREQTYAYARDLADFVSPSAISVIKRQLYDVPFQTLAEATIDANREMQIALKGSDFREGVASFVEKRPPRFTGK